MKKKIIFGIFFTILLYIIFYKYLPPYTPVKSAQLISGLKIPRGAQFEMDESHFNFTGSGHTIFIIALDDKRFDTFTKMNNWKKYKRLPMEKVYILTVYDSFFEKKPNEHDNGYYKIVKTDNSFKMVIVDNSQKKILIYETID